MRPTCAICGFRDAIGWTEYEGRRIKSCIQCDEPEVSSESMSATDDDKSIATRAMEALRFAPGSTRADLCEMLGLVDERGADCVGQALKRAVQNGSARAEGKKYSGMLYFPTGKEFRVVKKPAPVQPRNCAHCGEEFLPPDHRMQSTCSQSCGQRMRHLRRKRVA